MIDCVTDDQELRSRRARSFGAQAAAYAEHRPDYPLDALRWGLPPDVEHVVDLGAGTGKLTENLLALGLRVTAVEPDEGMRAEFTRRLPDLPVLDGTAERIPLPDGAADAVVAGQAFHWFDVQPALTEIARVTRAGGTFLALWNSDDVTVPWVAEFGELTRTSISRSWRSFSGELPSHEQWEPFERGRFRHTQRRTAESLLATVATHSHMLVAPPEERETTLTRLREFLAKTQETADGEFDLPLLVTAMRGVRR